MTSELTCPFCNAALADANAGTTGRVACPRCGEPLPAGLANQLGTTRSVAPPSEQPRVPGRLATLAVVLTVMVLMASLGLGYALWSKSFRRDNDFRTLKGTPPLTATTASALGLVPPRSNVVALLNVGTLLKQPASRQLISEPPGWLAWTLQRLEQWTGLRAGDIDHLAFGAEVRQDLPRLTMLVQLRQPLEEKLLVKRLAPAAATKHRERTLFRLPLPPSGEALVWRHSDRVLAVVLCLDAAKVEDLDAIPAAPRAGLDGFAEPLRDLIQTRIDKGAAAWIAGRLDDANVIHDGLALWGAKTDDWAPLLATRAFAVSLQPQDGLTLLGHLFTGDAQAAQRLKHWLESRPWPEATSRRVEGPPTDVVEADAQWVSVQMRGGPGLLRPPE